MNNIICYDSDGNVIKHLYQWDTNQTITLTGIDISPVPVFHFCNRLSDALVVQPTENNNMLSAPIPNILLQEAEPIVIYIFEDTQESCRTIQAVRIPVLPRPKPSDYNYEENIDYINWMKLEDDMKKRVDKLISDGQSLYGDFNSAVAFVESIREDVEESAEQARQAAEDSQKSLDSLGDSVSDAQGAATRAEQQANRAEECADSIDPSLIQAQIANKGDNLYYDSATNLLYLMSNGQVIGDGIQVATGTGGGGGGSTSIVKLINENGDSSITIATGNSVILSFTFTSIEDGFPTGNGTCSVIVNSITQEVKSIEQGFTSIDVTKYLKAGSNNVKIKCEDVYGNSKILSYIVSVIDLSIVSTFIDSMRYDGEIQYKYTPYGAVKKTIHFIVDGTEFTTFETSASGKQYTQILPDLDHGSHTLEVYSEAIINDSVVKSESLIYDIICVDENNKTPVISSAYNVSTTSQGSQISIPYIVYDPSALLCDIYLSVDTIVDDTVINYSNTPLTVDRSKQVWKTRDYPLGKVRFSINYLYHDPYTGDEKVATKSHIVEITEGNFNIEPITNDLELILSSAGRSNNEADPAQWSYINDEKSIHITTAFENVNWTSTGWLQDDNGDTVLRLNGDASAEIDFQPFKDDLRIYGKTIELEFAIRDVNNRDAVVIDCMNGGIGFTVTADKALIQSENSNVFCHYRDEEKIRLAFVVESRSEYRMLSVYLNGVLSGVKQYPLNDNFQQNSPANIKIGSPYCGVDVYTIRSYSTALTHTEVRDNYIYDTSDIVEKYELFDENDIYDEYGQLSYEKLKGKISVMTIVGDLPESKGDKKNVRIKYECLFNSEYSFDDPNVSIDVQGTSSQWYVRKNYKIKCSEKHQHADGQIPSAVFCVKADYAESTSTHNTQNANMAHTLYTEKTPAQLQDERCRSTIYGYPIVIFHQATETSNPEFIGKYNFNYDKGSEEVFGFTSNFDVESWEFKNNTSGACNFLTTIPENWSEDFEARYPEENTDLSRFRIMHDWVVSTNQNTATNDSLGQAYTDIDGITHTNDTAEYRLAKFKSEFEDYFDMHFSLIYYVYTFVALMVDQRAKNMFLTYWGENGKWQPWLYDNDTSFGINNEGEMVFDFYHEDTDIVNNENVYNGQNSTLWVNFRMAFPDRIEETYQNLRNNNHITSDKFVDYFITHGSDQWSASVYNEDSDYKYISMLRSDNDASNLYQVRGTGEEHFRYFIENRLNYCDSKWYASDYANDYVSLRVYTPVAWAGVEPDPSITITPFSDMYAGVRYKANGTLVSKRATRNIPIKFSPPTGTDLSYDESTNKEDFSDTESAIYGASSISSLGDLAPLYCGTLNLSNANKLIELKVGDATEGYCNEHLHFLSVGTNRLLKKIDVRNCPKLTAPLALSGCPNIEEIYATGSGITGVELPDSGCVKIMHLPATITNFTITNQIYLQDVTFEGYDNIKTLHIENCPSENCPDIDGLSMLNKCKNLVRVRLTDVNWSFDDASYLLNLADKNLKGIDENGDNTDMPWIDGNCHISELTGTEMSQLKTLYPYLNITYDKLTAWLTFMSHDGSTELAKQEIVNGTDGTDPIIETPAKNSTAQYHFTFAGWSWEPDGDVSTTALKNVEVNRTVYAAFTATIRTYTVYFYNNDGTEFEDYRLTDVPYGSSVVYPGDTPIYQTDVEGLSKDYRFDCWSHELSNIVGDTHCYAQYNFIGYNSIRLVERYIGNYNSDTLSVIGDYAFYNCDNLTQVEFSNVTSIGSNAFANCKNLTSVILSGSSICSLIANNAFTGTPIENGNGFIYVPGHLLDDYRGNTNWPTYANQLVAIEESMEVNEQ